MKYLKYFENIDYKEDWEEEDEDEDIYTVGDVVRLKKESSFYRQSGGGNGVIRSEPYIPKGWKNYWVSISWDNGKQNNYPVEDLIKI